MKVSVVSKLDSRSVIALLMEFVRSECLKAIDKGGVFNG